MPTQSWTWAWGGEWDEYKYKEYKHKYRVFNQNFNFNKLYFGYNEVLTIVTQYLIVYSVKGRNSCQSLLVTRSNQLIIIITSEVLVLAP